MVVTAHSPAAEPAQASAPAAAQAPGFQTRGAGESSICSDALSGGASSDFSGLTEQAKERIQQTKAQSAKGSR
jgi:hypothetical protein